jgi:SEC-C motif-containing protein
MMTFTPIAENCLCGSGLTYSACCARYHSGEHFPPSAEALMRSRFTAYARRDIDYLLASWDKGKRPAKIDFSRETAHWHELHILNTKKGQHGDKKGIVEFKAFYTQDGEEYFMHEISRFAKEGQRWLYVDGVIKSVSKVTVNNTGNKG